MKSLNFIILILIILINMDAREDSSEENDEKSDIQLFSKPSTSKKFNIFNAKRKDRRQEKKRYNQDYYESGLNLKYIVI